MDSYHLSVVRIEGIKDVSGSYCYVYLGNNILRVLTLENFDVQPIPIIKGTLRFVIEDSQSSVTIASLSFNSDIFKRVGYHWLPLYFFHEQCLDAVPDEVKMPRILFDVQTSMLSPVQEITEDSETYEDFEENNEELLMDVRNIAISMRVNELEANLNMQKSNFESQIEQIRIQSKSVIESLNANLDSKDKLINEQQARLQENQREIENLKKFTENLASEKEKLVGKYEKICLRESSILAMLEQKDLEIFKLVQMANKKSENISICQCDFISLKNQLFFRKDQENNVRKIIEFEQKFEIFKPHEEIHQRLKTYLSGKKLDDFAVVAKEMLYNFGGKKAAVYLKSDGIYCRTSGITKKIDGFLQNCSQEIDLFQRKKKSSEGVSHKRLYTSMEFERIGGIIHKTFDGRVRTSSNKKFMHRDSVTPVKKRLALSPSSTKFASKVV